MLQATRLLGEVHLAVPAPVLEQGGEAQTPPQRDCTAHHPSFGRQWRAEEPGGATQVDFARGDESVAIDVGVAKDGHAEVAAERKARGHHLPDAQGADVHRRRRHLKHAVAVAPRRETHVPSGAWRAQERGHKGQLDSFVADLTDVCEPGRAKGWRRIHEGHDVGRSLVVDRRAERQSARRETSVETALESPCALLLEAPTRNASPRDPVRRTQSQ